MVSTSACNDGWGRAPEPLPLTKASSSAKDANLGVLHIHWEQVEAFGPGFSTPLITCYIGLTMIYGKRDLRAEEREWVDQLTVFETGFVENLHAKCYLNENIAIISSMNLYEFSQQNNDEMGIRVDREGDPQLYQEIKTEAERLLRKATERQSRGYTSATSPKPVQENNGFCIRCREVINFSQAEPLCGKCYRSWARYGNEDYEEVFCHLCGEVKNTTKAKPFCYQCFRRTK